MEPVQNALYGSSAGGRTIDGEPVLFSAHLSNRWYTYRTVDCCCKWTWLPLVTTGIPFLGIPYLLCSASARAAEYNSFQLHVTPTALHYTMKQYAMGCCCQVTVKKSIPLDKIQDILLISDCCGDCWGFAPKGTPWQLHVQTAGNSGPGQNGGPGPAELIVHCLDDPEAFRSKVLMAKRALMMGAPVTGASKDSVTVPGGAFPPGESTAILAVLERIERAVNEGVAHAKSRGAAAEPRF